MHKYVHPPVIDDDPVLHQAREVPVGSVFRIGDEATTLDIKIGDDERFLVWVPGQADDMRLAAIANWGKFMTTEAISGSHPDYAALRVPTGTRSARTILSGVQAWSGEKKEVLDFVAGYIRETRHVFGKTDVSLSLSTVARTQTGEFFVTPPHFLEADEDTVREWSKSLHSEIENTLLTGEQSEQAHDLSKQFFDSIGVSPEAG